MLITIAVILVGCPLLASGVSASAAPLAPPIKSIQSPVWSGYYVTGSGFTEVTGTWIIPRPTASSVQTMAATWVGIGGTSSRDLIQAGTIERVSTGGQVLYYAWVELFPAASVRVPLWVDAGDLVTVTIAQQTIGTWLISIVNQTTGLSYETTQQYNSSLSSAEWVEEAPSDELWAVIPLENFGSVHFTDGSAVKNGRKSSLTQLGAKPISMIDGYGHILASPSFISDDGGSFDVIRTGPRAPIMHRF